MDFFNLFPSQSGIILAAVQFHNVIPTICFNLGGDLRLVFITLVLGSGVRSQSALRRVDLGSWHLSSTYTSYSRVGSGVPSSSSAPRSCCDEIQLAIASSPAQSSLMQPCAAPPSGPPVTIHLEPASAHLCQTPYAALRPAGIPLLFYIAWLFVALGNVPREGVMVNGVVPSFVDPVHVILERASACSLASSGRMRHC